MKSFVLCAVAVGAALLNTGCGSSDAATLDPGLEANANAAPPAVLNSLKDMVNIETGTGDAVGMPQMQDYLASRLTALGASVQRVPAAAGVVGENIVGRLSGTGTKKIMLTCHMDTVYPRGFLASSPFRIDGNKAYGPGIADCKGGIATILHSLEILNSRGFKDYGQIIVLFNTDEEKGSFGSRDLIQQLAAESDAVLVFESTTEQTTLQYSGGGSGIYYVQADVKGKSAHAGTAEQGVNALVEAADLIGRTTSLDDKANEFRFTWTLAKAGVTSNAVPDSATINADVRYAKPEQIPPFKDAINQLAQMKKVPGAQTTITLTAGRPPFTPNAGGLAMVANIVNAYSEINVNASVYPVRTTGASDAAYASLTGKPVIDNLGIPGANFHSNLAEYIRIDQIAKTLYADMRLIMDISQGKVPPI